MQIPKNIKWDHGHLTVLAKEAVVTTDWHVPGESKIWYRRLLSYIKEHKIKTLIVGGDFWNFDTLSRFVIKDRKWSLAQEIDRGLEILYTLTELCNVYLTRGNHDRRIVESFDGELSFAEWMNSFDIPNLHVTNDDYLHLISNKVTWRICHPDAYSRIKGNSVSKIAHARQENTILGHSHYHSVSSDSSGKYVCVDSGCMCEGPLFEYKNAATNPLPEWENCFLHIKDGKLKVISDYTF